MSDELLNEIAELDHVDGRRSGAWGLRPRPGRGLINARNNAEPVLLGKPHDVVVLRPGVLLVLSIPVDVILRFDLVPGKMLLEPTRAKLSDHLNGALALPGLYFTSQKGVNA